MRLTGRFALLLLLLGWVAGLRDVAAQAVQRRVLPAAQFARGSAPPLAAHHRTCYQLAPRHQPPLGLLILLPGRGEPARNVFRATRQYHEAAARSLVVLALGLNNRVYLDSLSLHVLDAAIGQVARHAESSC